MSWFWNALVGGGSGGSGGKKNDGSGSNVSSSNNNRRRHNKAPSMTRQTSVKMRQFEKRRTGSLILSKDDIKAVNLQSKIEQTRRKIDHDRLNHQDELHVLKNLKENLRNQVNDKLGQVNDVTIYQEIIQNIFIQEGLSMANPGDGKKEAEILKEIHKSELKENVRNLFQQQASDELIEIYKMTPQFKERMGEREAKMLSMVFQKDALLAQRRELYDQILKLQKDTIAALKKAGEQQFQKRYQAVRDDSGNDNDNDAEDGDLVSRNPKRDLAGTQSYSTRILGKTNIQETTKTKEQQHHDVGTTDLKDVALHNDQPEESHIGEVKKHKSQRSPTRAGTTTERSRSPKPSTSSSAAAAAAAAAGSASRNILSPPRRTTDQLSTPRTAAATTRVRARPTPPSRAGAGTTTTKAKTSQPQQQQQQQSSDASGTTMATTTTRRIATRPTNRPANARAPVQQRRRQSLNATTTTTTTSQSDHHQQVNGNDNGNVDNGYGDNGNGNDESSNNNTKKEENDAI